MRSLTIREERVINMHGMPAAVVAIAIGSTVHEVLEIRAQRRAIGALPAYVSERVAGGRQLQLDIDP